ncbi:MAG: 23S rRNA (adenine(2503)-C(2))-methyltransferase RlmN [Pirellulaceae bacterium]|nr:23S rRNA (adenine(2503)-C(2))-methyltransferase RlmN [Pirellulaceae bacterium]
MSSHPVQIQKPERPSLHQPEAVEQFRRDLRLDPERVRKFRYLLYQQHRPLDQALDAFGQPARSVAQETFDTQVLKVVQRLDSSVDPSVKLILETHDGHRLETVLIRSGPSRAAVCVSTQVGCQAGCPFCATARMGLRRNLTASEIAQQVLLAAQITRADNRRLRNIVFMGMGEPLHNEAELYESIHWFTNPRIFNLPPRRLSVSTVGVPDAMRRLIDTFPGIQMAFSLHSARPELRAKLVPWSRRYSWQETQEALRYVASRPKLHRHQGPVMIEHILIEGLNDSDADADALIEYLDGMYVMINLIPYNPTDFVQNWQPTSRDRRGEIAKRLREAGFFTTIRYSMGSDVQAACGQLVQKSSL